MYSRLGFIARMTRDPAPMPRIHSAKLDPGEAGILESSLCLVSRGSVHAGELCWRRVESAGSR